MAAILSLAASLNIIAIDGFNAFSGLSDQDFAFLLVQYDGVISFIMLTIITTDKYAAKQAVILAFAVTCHSMVSLYLITESQAVENATFLFYEYYDELIIMTAILQMAVTKNGMVQGLDNSFGFLQNMLFRVVFHYHSNKNRSDKPHKRASKT